MLPWGQALAITPVSRIALRITIAHAQHRNRRRSRDVGARTAGIPVTGAHRRQRAARLRYHAAMRVPRWVLTALVLLPLAALGDPAADAERDATRAYVVKDYKAFLARMRKLQASEPSLPRLIYNLAAAEALAGSPDEAVKLLHRLAGTGLAFAIDKDDDFRKLRARADFQAEVRAMKANREPHGSAEPAFTLDERDLLTEGVAYDPQTRTFFVSSIRHRKIIAIDDQGRQRDFVPEAKDGITGVFGMAVDPTRRVLWAATSPLPHMVRPRGTVGDVAALYKYDLATGKRVGRYPVPIIGNRPHVLGDVIVSSRGVAYTTDSATPALYRVDPLSNRLELVFEGFTSLQGLALSADEKILYLADYARGLYAVGLTNNAVSRVEVAPNIAATGIDGLYLHRGRLIATQNGVEPHRVVAFDLEVSNDPRPTTRLVGQHIVLSGDPRIADLSLGVIVGDAMYLNAAAGWAHYGDDGKPESGPAAPHVILKLALPQ